MDKITQANMMVVILLLGGTVLMVQTKCSVRKFQSETTYNCHIELICWKWVDEGYTPDFLRCNECKCGPDYDEYDTTEDPVNVTASLTVNLTTDMYTNDIETFSYLNELADHIVSVSATNGIMSTIDTFFYKLSNVTNVYISNNTIERLTLSKFAHLTHLQHLNLSYNGIITLETAEVSNEHVSTVSVIDLSHNLIETIPNAYFSKTPHVLHLNLSHNSIRSVNPRTFEGLSQLQTLRLTNNKLTAPSTNFGNLAASLQDLHLDFNYLTSLHEINLNQMSCKENLQYLNLNDNPISDVSPDTLFGFTQLVTLDITHTHVNVLKNGTFTKMIFLKNFNASHGDIKTLEYNVFNLTKSLEVVDLSHNQIELFHVNKSSINLLKEIYLNNNKLKYVPKQAFSGLEYLRILNLGNNDIISVESNAFRGVQNLESLNMSNNPYMIFNSSILSDLKSIKVIFLCDVTILLTHVTNANSSLTKLDVPSSLPGQ